MAVPAAPAPSRETAAGLRLIRIGLLGFGHVGQAVARAAAAAAPRLREHGLALSLECALVRDVSKPRRGPKAARLTSNAEAFLRGRYDAVIDALPGREPAATILGRVLGKGIPVASANKVLIAAEGRRLRRIALRAGTTLRVDAAVMAGVPFLGAFERRPMAAHVWRFAGVVNGTSHFVLSRLADGVPFDTALGEAQARGYAEPDPAADLSGRDALEKLVILAETLFGAAIRPQAVAIEGIANLTPDDLAAAARAGGQLKPVIFAERVEDRDGPRVNAFVGPAWVPASHPLAGITGRDNAIVIDSRGSGRLVFAGPGAGPDVTAATLLDDAIEGARDASPASYRTGVTAVVRWPETGWFTHGAKTWRVLHD